MSNFQLLTLPLVRARSYNAYAIMTAKSQRFSERNPTAFASSFKTPAARFRSAPSTCPAFSAIFPRVFASLLVALAPFFTAFRAPTAMVVMTPATEMATTEIPPRFLLTHLLNLSILVRSFFSASSSTMLRASSPSGRMFARRRISSAFSSATSAMDSKFLIRIGLPFRKVPPVSFLRPLSHLSYL